MLFYPYWYYGHVIETMIKQEKIEIRFDYHKYD